MTHQTMADNSEGAGPAGKQIGIPVVKRQCPWWLKSEIMTLIVAGVLLLAGLAAEKLLALELPAVGLYLATLAVGGFYPARSALRALRTGRLTISTLVVVAALGAVVLGVYEEAALLIVVFSLGDVLEEYTSDRARGSIRALMALTPSQAQRSVPDGSLETVPVEQLIPGDVVVVRPGERLPTDGVVVSGASAVDQSPVTGESLPVEITPGATVFGGTINGTGALEMHEDAIREVDRVLVADDLLATGGTMAAVVELVQELGA